MTPLIAGLVGAGGGIALWEFLLKPAPFDNVVYVAQDRDFARGAETILEANGIPSRVDQVWGSTYAVLVKHADGIEGVQLMKDVKSIPRPPSGVL